MKHFLFAFFFCGLLPVFLNAGNPQVIAVYNMDSVLVTMPGYEMAMKEYVKYDSMITRVDSLMDLEYQKKIGAFYTDSAKFSPIIRQLKRQEIHDLGERISEFRQDAVDDLENKKIELLKPLKEKISVSVIELGKQNHYLTVICCGGYINPQHRFIFDSMEYGTPEKEMPVLVNETLSQPAIYIDPKIKTVNITKLLIEKLKK
jgi:outer membrane protein